MSRGPAPEPSHDEYVAAVEELYGEGETNEAGGVPARAVAEHLDVPLTTAHYHLDGLVEQGRLESVYEFSGTVGGAPPRGFLPSGGTCQVKNLE